MVAISTEAYHRADLEVVLLNSVSRRALSSLRATAGPRNV
jgi:hypothetical protein